MKPTSKGTNSTRTSFIQLDTKKCTACWKCLTECKNGVIGRVNLPWHKHSRFLNSNDCTGCMKCINICEAGALKKISSKESENYSGKTSGSALIVNIGLLIIGFAMSISGFAIQIKYHMGHNPGLETADSIPWSGYYNLTNIHKTSVILFSILIAYHIFVHLKWYKTVISKKLLTRNRLQITLTITLILAVITGYIPWIIDLSDGSEIARKIIIEIHDKITILLFILMLLHLTNKTGWYINTLGRLKNKHRA